MSWKDLEDEFTDAIQRCLQTDEDVEEAKKYFKDYTVEQLIDSAYE